MSITSAVIEKRQRYTMTELLIIGFVAAYPLVANPFFAPIFGLPKLTLLLVASILIISARVGEAIAAGSHQLALSYLRLPLISFFVLAIFSGVQSIHPLTSLLGQYGRWEGLVTITSYAAFYVAGRAIAIKKGRLELLFAALFISATIVSLIAIAEHFWGNPFLSFARIYCAAGYGQPNTYETGRSMAAFGSPTFLGTYLALIVPVLFSAAVSSRHKMLLKSFYITAFPLVIVALLLAYARAAWIGAAVGIALVGLLRFREKKLQVRLSAMLIVIILMIVLVQALPGTYSVSERIASIFKVTESGQTRIQMWQTSLALVAEDPLLGSGPDTFKYVFAKYKPQGWVEHISDPLIDKAHNDVLQVTVTQGVLSLLAYLWLLVSFMWLSLKRVHLIEDQALRWLSAGILGAVASYIIGLQFSFSHFTTAPFFWLLLGIASSIFMTGDRTTSLAIRLTDIQKRYAFGVLAVATLCAITISGIPLAADVYFTKGRDFQAQGKLAEAARSYRIATILNRYEPLYRLSYGEALFKIGHKTNSEEYLRRGAIAFTEAQRINPIDEQVYFRPAAVYLAAGRAGRPDYLRKAIIEHSAGLTLNPVMVDAYLDIGVAYAHLNNYDDAINAWHDALAIEPQNGIAYFNLGWAYEQMGENSLAKDAYFKAYNVDPEMTDAKNAYDRL